MWTPHSTLEIYYKVGDWESIVSLLLRWLDCIASIGIEYLERTGLVLFSHFFDVQSCIHLSTFRPVIERPHESSSTIYKHLFAQILLYVHFHPYPCFVCVAFAPKSSSKNTFINVVRMHEWTDWQSQSLCWTVFAAQALAPAVRSGSSRLLDVGQFEIRSLTCPSKPDTDRPLNWL